MRTLYYNGNLYTGDPENPAASAMAVEDGTIVWAGNDSEGNGPWKAESPGEGQGRKVDLKGRFVTPGFIDSHMHVVEYGKLLREVPLADYTCSLEQVCGRVKRFIDSILFRRPTSPSELDFHQ